MFRLNYKNESFIKKIVKTKEGRKEEIRQLIGQEETLEKRKNFRKERSAL